MQAFAAALGSCADADNFPGITKPILRSYVAEAVYRRAAVRAAGPVR
jgi:hypothetical protein